MITQLAEDGNVWGLEPPDESVGIFGWAIWHESCQWQDTDVVPGSVTVTDDVVKAECECGAKIDIEREV